MRTTFRYLRTAAADEAHVWEYLEGLSRAARVDALTVLLEGARS
jgi:hypothetical protein